MKNCAKILAKEPNHPETIAMKALFMVFLNQKEEGLKLIRKSVKLKFESQVSWHLYGII